MLQLRQRQRDELKVRAGLTACCRSCRSKSAAGRPGHQPGARREPGRLKAEIKIAETQAKDIQIGQKAEIDTRNGIVQGRVTRIDPSVQNGTRTVDVSLDGELPRGAVPDLSVDGTIELERLNDVLFMGRPAFGQEQSTITLVQGRRRRQRRESRAGEAGTQLGEHDGDPVGPEGRRHGHPVGHVGVGRVRSREADGRRRAIAARRNGDKRMGQNGTAGALEARWRDQGVLHRRGRDARAVGHPHGDRQGRVRLDRRTVGLRQVDAAVDSGPARLADRRAVPPEQPAGRRRSPHRSARASATARSGSSSRAST